MVAFLRATLGFEPEVMREGACPSLGDVSVNIADSAKHRNDSSMLKQRLPRTNAERRRTAALISLSCTPRALNLRSAMHSVS